MVDPAAQVDPSPSAPGEVAKPAVPQKPVVTLRATALRPEIREIKSASEQIQKWILPAAGAETTSDAEKPRPLPLALRQISKDALLEQIQRSCAGIKALSDHMAILNRIGSPTDDRAGMTGAAVMPIALLHVHNRLTSTANPATEGEERLLRVFVASHGNMLEMPDWFTPARPFLELTGRMADLPGANVYLMDSKSAAEKFKPLQEKYSELYTDTASTRDRLGPDHETTLKMMGDLNQIELEMENLLSETDDIKPEFVRDVCRRVAVSVTFKPELAAALTAFHNSLGRQIAILSGAVKMSDGPLPLELPLLSVEAGGARVERARFDARPFVDAPDKDNLLGVLCRHFVSVKEALLTVQKNWEQHFSRNPEHRDALRGMQTALENIFPGNSEISRNTHHLLLRSQCPALNEAATRLLSLGVRTAQDGGTHRVSSVLESPDNIQLLAQAVSTLLKGKSADAEPIAASMKQTVLQPALDLITRVRTAIETKKSMTVARVLDEELKRAQSGGGARHLYPERAALLLGLDQVSQDEKLRRNLKGNLKNLDTIPALAKAVTGSLGTQNSAALAFVEACRKDITKRFAFDLSDYCGQREVVGRWRNQLEKHLLLLGCPEAWAGCTPGEAFLNGYLLYGCPGAGKTFLVNCMANDLGLPLVSISREEMAEAFDAVRQKLGPGNSPATASGQKNTETMLASFMRTKISEAEQSMQRSGAPACMLFIDEMEAEFIKRELVADSPHQIALTNIMLRVLEGEIASHANIIFVAATNHINLVDPAALRLGRFGIHVRINLTSAEDVRIITDRILEKHEVDLGEQRQGEGYSKFVESAVSMTPLAIIKALSHLCCNKRREAIQGGGEAVVTLAELQEAVTTMKSMGHKPDMKGQEET